MPRERWVALKEIYQIVEEHWDLDDEDLDPQSPDSTSPKWKRNVRNKLQTEKRKGEIQWDGNARYWLP